MLEVVVWKWKPRPGYRSTFGPNAVNEMARQVALHYSGPHRFTCITDDGSGVDSNIRIIPLWNDFHDIPNPSNSGNPSCYRRLRLFSAQARELIGERIVSLDLDIVVTGDLSPIFDRTEDFVMWGDTAPNVSWYNGSLILLTAGSRTKVFEAFDPIRSPAMANAAGQKGSDQGWIGYCLGPHEAKFGTKDGVYSWRNHLVPQGGRLPADARMVVFHGRHDPWMPELHARYPWIREHYGYVEKAARMKARTP